MRRPTFLEGVAVAFVASFLGSAVYGALTTVLPAATTLRVATAGISLGYAIYLVARSRNPVGRMTSVVLWGAVAGATWLTYPPLVLYVSLHMGLVWLVRSVYFHASALSALADLGLSLLGLLAAAWAATETGSPFLSIWSLFLTQALFVAIPPRMGRNTADRPVRDDHLDPFERAHRNAQAALRRLSSVR